jgi:hypothetical protein
MASLTAAEMTESDRRSLMNVHGESALTDLQG